MNGMLAGSIPSGRENAILARHIPTETEFRVYYDDEHRRVWLEHPRLGGTRGWVHAGDAGDLEVLE